MQPLVEQPVRIPERLLRLLACPLCDADLRPETGSLRCDGCSRAFPVSGAIPRFVTSEAYAESFGFQWNRYRAHQLDSRNGTELSAQRFFTETGFTPSWLADKVVLDAGCGAGRFAEIAARHAAHVVAVDLSSAVDAARQNLEEHANVDVVQASISALPFRPGAFDGVYCIGVLQHTPDPPGAAAALPFSLKPDGRLAITAYERKWYTRLNGKYLVRPLTRRLPPRLLARGLSLLMPALFALTEILFRIPAAKKVFRFILPVANYVGVLPLRVRQRYRWALLDTFDMLSPAHDKPMTELELREALIPNVGGIQRRGNPGLNLTGVREAQPATDAARAMAGASHSISKDPRQRVSSPGRGGGQGSA